MQHVHEVVPEPSAFVLVLTVVGGFVFGALLRYWRSRQVNSTGSGETPDRMKHKVVS